MKPKQQELARKKKAVVVEVAVAETMAKTLWAAKAAELRALLELTKRDRSPHPLGAKRL